MGTTANLALPYPEDEDLVRLGANDMQELAEAVDAELWAPALRLRCANEDTVDAGDRGDIVSYDPATLVDPVLFIRGAWTFEDTESLIIPPTLGVYLVVVEHSKPITETAAVIAIETRVSAAAHATAVIWSQEIVTVADVADIVRLVHTAIVVVDAVDTGIQVGVNAPSTTNGSGSISIHRLSGF